MGCETTFSEVVMFNCLDSTHIYNSGQFLDQPRSQDFGSPNRAVSVTKIVDSPHLAYIDGLEIIMLMASENSVVQFVLLTLDF